MIIKKYEQSGFIITSNKGSKLAIDIGCKTSVENLHNVQVDFVLISHKHADHFSPEHIEALNSEKVFLNEECLELLTQSNFNTEIIFSDSTILFSDFKVEIFSVDHGPNSGPIRDNFGFLIECDNQKIYFAGDMYNPSGIDVSSLEVDYALIPVGGFYTFDPEQALEFCKRFKKIGKVISMHYERNAYIDPITHLQFIDISRKIFNVQ